MDWDLYTDWRLRPNAQQTTFADGYSDLTLNPKSWLSLTSMTRYDIQDGDWRMSLTTLNLHPRKSWSWTLGQVYLRDDLSTSPTSLGVGNNLFTSSFYFRLNENWGLRTSHWFEARTGTLQEQDYAIYRDLRSWTAALTFQFRNSPGAPEDFTVALTFWLKAYPKPATDPRRGCSTDIAIPLS